LGELRPTAIGVPDLSQHELSPPRASEGRTLAGGYAHAKQLKRHRRQLRSLQTWLGRLLRDIRRKIIGQVELEAAFERPLSRAAQIRPQEQRRRVYKLYPFLAPRSSASARASPAHPTSSASRPRSPPPKQIHLRQD